MIDLTEALQHAAPENPTPPNLTDLQRRAARRRSTIRGARFSAVLCVAIVLTIGATMTIRARTDNAGVTPATEQNLPVMIERTSPNGVSVTLTSNPDDPVLDNIARRIEQAREVERQNGQPTMPDECVPTDAITITSPTTHFEATESVPVRQKDLDAAVAPLTRLPTAPIGAVGRELMIIVHSAQAPPGPIELVKDGQVIDSADTGTPWAILFAPIGSDFQPVTDQISALNLHVRAASSTAPLYPPETAGTYC